MNATTASVAEPTVARTSPSPSSTEAVVRVCGLTKSFPERRGWKDLLLRPFRPARTVTVVNDVSFDVMPSEFFGLLGANGAGKTTLFRMLSTQLLPDSGTAFIAGREVVRDAAAVQGLLTPVAADERSLNWRLTARENLELFAALYGIAPDAAARRVSELLDIVELSDTGSKMVGTFSSGMKQRLLIARALLPQPRVLLLDEPTRSLDPISARRFRRFLREEIAGRQQCTVLLATHNAEEAFELCDRVAVLDRGRLMAVGRVDELVELVHDDTYRLTVRESHIAQFGRTLQKLDRDWKRVAVSDDADWAIVEIRIAGGPAAAAELLAKLTAAHIDVASLERRPLTLADLLERIVSRERDGS